MTTNNAAKFQEIDLDAGLDDWPDLPTFKAPPPGSYISSFPDGLVQKVVGEHNAVEVKGVIMEVNEVKAGFEDETPKIGDTWQVLYMLDNAVGVGQLKELLKIVLPAVGATKPNQVIATEGNPNPSHPATSLVAITVLTRQSPKLKAGEDESDQKHYTRIKSFLVA